MSPAVPRHCSTHWARAGVTLLGTLRCVWVLIFGAIRPGAEPKSSSNWPLPVILPDKTIKFLRQEMFFANGLCQMLLLFLSVVFKDLFLILTHYFMRHRLVLPALLKLSITLMFVCCLRASLTVCEGFFCFIKKKKIQINILDLQRAGPCETGQGTGWAPALPSLQRLRVLQWD